MQIGFLERLLMDSNYNHNKRILYVVASNLDNGSSSSKRNQSFIKGLEEYNNVTVLCVKSNLKYKNEINFKQRLYNKQSNKSNRFYKSIKRTIAKIINCFNIYGTKSNLSNSLEELEFDNNEFDYLISSSDPKISHYIAEQLICKKIVKTRKWIQYWGDPFYDDINRKNSIFKNRIKKEENRLLYKANLIIYTSPFTLENQSKLFPSHSDKMIYIPTPYYSHRLIASDSTFTIGYFGSYNSSDRNILPFYEFCKKNNIKSYIVGDSNLKLKGTDDLIVKNERISQTEVEKLENKCSLFVCLANKGKSSQIPGKIYYYGSTNIPVLIIFDHGKAERIFNYFSKYENYHGCFNDTDSISNEVYRIISARKSYLPVEDFYYKNVIKKVDDALKRLDKLDE